MVIEKLVRENMEDGSVGSYLEVAQWMRRNEDCKLWELELGFYRAFYASATLIRSNTWQLAMRLYIEGAE